MHQNEEKMFECELKNPFAKKNFKIMMVLFVHFLPRIRCENVFYVPMKIPDYIAIF